MVAALEVMADQIAAAIDNANLFEESQTTLKTLRRVYGEMSQEAWMELANERRPLGYVAGRDAVAPVSGKWQIEMEQVSQEQEVLRVEEGRTLVVPLMARGEVIGALRLRKGSGSRGWTSREINLVDTLVDQLGVALESARLYQDTRRRAVQERMVGEVMGQVRETLDLERMIRTAVEELRPRLGLERFVIQLGTPDGQETLE
jgi:GAF domain-containing protein